MPARLTANGDRVELFVPLAKFDQRTGEFEAWATVEELDNHGEICDVDLSWPALLADAKQQSEISNGQSVGNLRRQHRRNAAIGKRTAMERRDRDGVDSVYIKGLVTDEQSKLDAALGVLTGVSIRGLTSRWPDERVKGAKRYAWTLVEEMSLVDSPAVPHALIEVMKSSGVIEMVKAAGRQVIQYWDCFNPSCASKHSRKEEAQKCETPEGDEPLPTSIEATQKAAEQAPAIEANVLMEKCLGCVASLTWVIRDATTSREPSECSGCDSSPCSGPPCAAYTDPGHEEMEAGVKQLWDGLRAMVADLRAKWMREEGVTDETAINTLDVAKMLDGLTQRLRETGHTNEVLKSLRVPTGNGSITNPKEGTMKEIKEAKKEETPAEETPAPAEEKTMEAILTKLDEIGGRLDAIETTQGTLSAAVADLQAKLPAESEAAKSAATKLDAIGAKVDEHGETLKSVSKTAQDLAEIVSNLPTVPKGVIRPVKKEDDGDTQKSEAKIDPFSSVGGAIRRLA